MTPRSFAVRRVGAFAALAFGGSWGIWVLAYGLALPPTQPGITLLRLAGFLLPALLAAAICRALEGRLPFRAWLRSAVSWRSLTWPTVALSLGLVPMLTVAAIGLDGRLASLASIPAALQFPGIKAGLLAIGFGWIVGPFCEELAWRGYVFQRLRPFLGPGRAALATSFLHALWHLPLFVMTNGPLHAIGLLTPQFWGVMAGILLLGVLAAILTLAQHGSVIGAALLHATFNAAGAWQAQDPHALFTVDALLLAVIICLVRIPAWSGIAADRH